MKLSSKKGAISSFITPRTSIFTYVYYDSSLSRRVNIILYPATISKTCLYNFDPLKPHFYIVKLGFTRVYNFFLFLLETIDYGYSLELPRRGGSNEYPQSMFWAEIWKYQNFYLRIFIFLVVKFSVYLKRHVFVMTKVSDFEHVSSIDLLHT